MGYVDTLRNTLQPLGSVLKTSRRIPRQFIKFRRLHLTLLNSQSQQNATDTLPL